MLRLCIVFLLFYWSLSG